jgi:mannose-1-phosphate guanylyltransferase
LITFDIVPTALETGYSYIKAGVLLDDPTYTLWIAS